MRGAEEKGLGGKVLAHVHFSDFISRMDLAYAAADLVVSRSGASSISELCAMHKASVFVPSPNVTEDHQTHNAMALVREGAALIVPDSEAADRLMDTVCMTVHDSARLRELEKNIAGLARTDAADAIVREVYRLIDSKK